MKNELDGSTLYHKDSAGVTVQIFVPAHADCTELVTEMKAFLLALGYHPNGIISAMEHVAWEMSPDEEGVQDV